MTILDLLGLTSIALALFLLIPEISGLVNETKEMERVAEKGRG